MTAPTLPTKAERDAMRERACNIHMPETREDAYASQKKTELAADCLRLLDWADAQEAPLSDAETARLLAFAQPAPGWTGLAVERLLVLKLLRVFGPERAICSRHTFARECDEECRPADMLSIAENGLTSEGPARRALRRLHSVGVNISTLDADAWDREWDAALKEAEAVLAGGQPAPRGPWALRDAKRRHMWADYSPQFTDRPVGWVNVEHRHLFTKLGPATEEGTARWAQRMHGGVVVKVKGAAK